MKEWELGKGRLVMKEELLFKIYCNKHRSRVISTNKFPKRNDKFIYSN